MVNFSQFHRMRNHYPFFLSYELKSLCCFDSEYYFYQHDIAPYVIWSLISDNKKCAFLSLGNWLVSDFLSTAFYKLLVYMLILSHLFSVGTPHYIMSEDHGNRTPINHLNTQLPYYWQLITMIVLCLCTRWSYWRWVLNYAIMYCFVVLCFLHLFLPLPMPTHG